jgi:hypothetical protein
MFKFSNKKMLVASVFTNAYFAETQERGGVKTPQRATKIAIPTAKVPKKYFKSSGLRQMRDERGNVFVDKRGAFQRVGKTRLKLLWSFARQATIRPRLKFAETASQTAEKKFVSNFEKRLSDALASAK